MSEIEELKKAVGKRIEEIEERLDKLENHVRPRLKAVETDDGIRFVVEPQGTSKWINEKYLDAVLEDVGLELSELEDSSSQSSGAEGGDSQEFF